MRSAPPPLDGSRFSGTVAAVTGGGKGLGRALVEALAAGGADVAFSYRDSRAGAEEAAAALRRAGRRVYTARADARVPGQIASFVEQAVEALGGLDLLVNNVGTFRRVPLEDLTEDVLDEAFAVNVKSAILATKAAAPHLRERRGSVVNVASLGGLRPWPSHVAYCSSKAALVMATRALARALAPDVRVNAVAPGVLDPPGADGRLRQRVPLGRFGSHAEAVEAVLFLADRATYTTGEVLRLDGGRGLA